MQPDLAENCLAALESAGYAAYFVGGCVRDQLMGLSPQDYDICTAALPEQTAAVFAHIPQSREGTKHGTVKLLLPTGEIEITTFRREGGYSDSRHPTWVEFLPAVDGDLARRDFTINAIAHSPVRGYADPFGGMEDIRRRILRCVGDPGVRFREDPLRILRGIRFAARFGLRVAPETMAAMTALAPLTHRISRERVYTELTGFLLAAKAADLQRFAPVLTAAIPELAASIGFDQCSPHHAYDVYTHTALVTQSVPGTEALRWAALLHDVAKPTCFTLDENGRGHFKGHAPRGADMAQEILTRLHAPAPVRREVCWLIHHHMTLLEPEEKQLRRALSRYGRQRLDALLCLQQGDMMSKGTQEHSPENHFAPIRRIVEQLVKDEGEMSLKNLAVNGNDLIQLGFSGKEIGIILNFLLEQVLDGTLTNTRSTLLQSAAESRKEGPYV